MHYVPRADLESKLVNALFRVWIAELPELTVDTEVTLKIKYAVDAEALELLGVPIIGIG